MWRLRPLNLLAAGWALLALIQVRRQLAKGISSPVISVHPFRHHRSARWAVDGVLERTSATCLEGALVRQVWLAREGHPYDLIIGVPESGLAAASAHAWLEGYEPEPESDISYLEIHRISPPR